MFWSKLCALILELYAINSETVGKMVRSVNETYLNILSPFPKCDFDTNKVSALSNFYSHPLRFIGTRLDGSTYP